MKSILTIGEILVEIMATDKGDGFLEAGQTGWSDRSFPYPGPEPDCLTRPVSGHDQPHIRSPLETAAPTSRLLRARAQANEAIYPIGI